jgi:phosphoribosyl-ATP pyrophosphohydrolase/phosphoribosyl-AMP cyclohydrolase
VTDQAFDVSAVDFAKGHGVVTVVTQDAHTGTVLMVAHADREALERTIATGEMHYRSRSRGLWHKGVTSGNVQRVVSLSADCDGDAVLARVIPQGPACHTGQRSCFGDAALDSTLEALEALDRTIAKRARAVDDLQTSSYTAALLRDRNLRLKKIGEESAELVTALADDDADRAAEEGADLVYHMLVALRAVGANLHSVVTVLASRAERAENGKTDSSAATRPDRHRTAP